MHSQRLKIPLLKPLRKSALHQELYVAFPMAKLTVLKGFLMQHRLLGNIAGVRLSLLFPGRESWMQASLVPVAHRVAGALLRVLFRPVRPKIVYF